jgi:hypothetical protein
LVVEEANIRVRNIAIGAPLQPFLKPCPDWALIIVSAIQEEQGNFLPMALQSTPWATMHPKAGAQRLLCRSTIADGPSPLCSPTPVF